MRLLFAFIALVAVAIIPLHAGATTANTIDELAAMYSIEKCADCHEDIHKEWASSWHGKSIVDPRVLRTFRTFIKSGLDKSPGAKRKDLKDVCLPCHVPQTKDASDELIVKISDLIVTAVDDKDAAKREAANKELAKLSINCLACHNLKGAADGNPKEKTIYGPGTASDTSPHKEELGYDSVKSDFIKTSKFCAVCHHGCPPDMPSSICPTLYTSYEEKYKAHGGNKTCQECHMLVEGKISHKFPGIFEADFAKQGVALTIDARPTEYVYHLENRIVPAVVVKVDVKNTSGHGMPHG